jgi:hypothetical protein
MGPVLGLIMWHDRLDSKKLCFFPNDPNMGPIHTRLDDIIDRLRQAGIGLSPETGQTFANSPSGDTQLTCWVGEHTNLKGQTMHHISNAPLRSNERSTCGRVVNALLVVCGISLLAGGSYMLLY